MIGRSAIWVARQHGLSISTMPRLYAACADGAPEFDAERIRPTLNSEHPLESAHAVRRRKPNRAIPGHSWAQDPSQFGSPIDTLGILGGFNYLLWAIDQVRIETQISLQYFLYT